MKQYFGQQQATGQFIVTSLRRPLRFSVSWMDTQTHHGRSGGEVFGAWPLSAVNSVDVYVLSWQWYVYFLEPVTVNRAGPNIGNSSSNHWFSGAFFANLFQGGLACENMPPLNPMFWCQFFFPKKVVAWKFTHSEWCLMMLSFLRQLYWFRGRFAV